MALRAYELVSSAHDALPAHQNRSFEGLDLFLSGMWKDLNMSLVFIELQVGSSIPASRALVFPNTDFLTSTEKWF